MNLEQAAGKTLKFKIVLINLKYYTRQKPDEQWMKENKIFIQLNKIFSLLF